MLALCIGLSACRSAAGPNADRPSPSAAQAEAPSTPAASASAPASPTADGDASPPQDLAGTAARLAHELVILDGHVDVPWRLSSSRDDEGELTEDITGRTEDGDFDYERAKAGGLDAPFMSIYVPAKFEKNGAKKIADGLIDMVEQTVAAAPEKYALARAPEEVRANFDAGKISLPMGMENGSPIEGKLANVEYFRDRGIRYITLAHSKDNHIADSSYDTRHTHGGLSPFGKRVVAEMNRVGIMIDVSHLSDDAAEQAIELSKVPVIASHSSCRRFTPGWERNMSDALIRKLAAKGGVIQINFGSAFIDAEIREAREENRAALRKLLADEGLELGEHAAKKIVDAYEKEHPSRHSTVEKVADHIEHVVKLVGVDHVGFGSDFDGVGDSLPVGLEDVSKYPNLIRVLLERGHSREEIEKIASGNVLRVWQAVEDHARSVSP